jgi:hypothetical protein
MGVNPHGLCTWEPESGCEGCDLEKELYCRWRRRHLNGFFSIMAPAITSAAVGLLLAGTILGSQLYIILYGGFMLLFFNVIETWLLCRHCPYYARSGKTLHCLANHGCLKLWKYNPAPMNGLERNTMRFFFALFFTYPELVQGYGLLQMEATWDLAYTAYMGLLIVTAVSSGAAYILLRKYFCSHCVNFSCPLNRVPQETVKRYLDRNPVMREAWKAAGEV